MQLGRHWSVCSGTSSQTKLPLAKQANKKTVVKLCINSTWPTIWLINGSVSIQINQHCTDKLFTVESDCHCCRTIWPVVARDMLCLAQRVVGWAFKCAEPLVAIGTGSFFTFLSAQQRALLLRALIWTINQNAKNNTLRTLPRCKTQVKRNKRKKKRKWREQCCPH